jgi:hypothetical protein
MATDVKRLNALAAELRAAAGDALAHESWFAPALDDCRVDIERSLSLVEPSELDAGIARTLGMRGEMMLRTWKQALATIQAGKSQWHCPCGGRLVDVARPGRAVPYRGQHVALPDDFVIPTCERCGSERLEGEAAKRFDALVMSAFMAKST